MVLDRKTPYEFSMGMHLPMSTLEWLGPCVTHTAKGQGINLQVGVENVFLWSILMDKRD